MKKILVALVACALLLLLTSCGPATNNTTSATNQTAGSTPTANPNAPPGNFLYTSSVEAMFLAWVNNNGALSGQTQDAQYGTDSNGNSIVNSTHGSFTGTHSNDQVSLNFGGFLGYSNTITGTYSNNTLTLHFPTKDGGVGTFVFVPATSDEFNTAVSTMQNTASNANANAAASAATAAAVQSQQQAVTDANTTVANDLSSLQYYVSNLKGNANFDSVFSGYANDWQSMQNDYLTEVNDSKNGCANGNYGTVQSDVGVVQSDEGSITSDDGSYDSQKASIDGDYGNTQHFISTLNSDWQALQQAVANNASGTPPSNYQQSDIDSAMMNIRRIQEIKARVEAAQQQGVMVQHVKAAPKAVLIKAAVEQANTTLMPSAPKAAIGDETAASDRSHETKDSHSNNMTIKGRI